MNKQGPLTSRLRAGISTDSAQTMARWEQQDQPGWSDVPRVLLVCSGLEHARRGFETFARECFDALRDDPRVRIELVKGSGAAGPAERAVTALRRDRPLAQLLGRMRGVPAFRIEAFSFAFAVLPLILRRKPDIVYFSEWDTGRVLARLRTVSRGGFKLVLCNGTLVGQGFEHLDHVQDLTPAAHEYALAHGADPARHTTLPLGFAISPTFVPLSEPERAAIRQQHGLPLDQRILLSVAALNRRHKRLDYVIREVASIPPNRRPFLLLLGEPDDETPALRAFAEDLLGNAGFAMRTIPPSQVTDLCRASDIFVLASFHESFGRALVEASATGIPCLVHGYPITEFVLGPNAYAGDLSGEGALARMITGLTEDDFTADRAATRHAYAYEMFSWDRLTPGYLELFQTALDGRTIAG